MTAVRLLKSETLVTLDIRGYMTWSTALVMGLIFSALVLHF